MLFNGSERMVDGATPCNHPIYLQHLELGYLLYITGSESLQRLTVSVNVPPLTPPGYSRVPGCTVRSGGCLPFLPHFIMSPKSLPKCFLQHTSHCL